MPDATTKTPVDFYAIAADPRVASVLLALIVGSLIIPVCKAFLKERKARNSLVRMLYEDVIDRNDRLTKSILSVRNIISRTQSEGDFIPIIIDAKGEEYLDLQAEKWLIPSNLTQPVLKFYNLAKGLEDFSSFIDGDKFSTLEKCRRVAVLEGMKDRMIRASRAGVVLISLIEADWPEVKRK